MAVQVGLPLCIDAVTKAILAVHGGQNGIFDKCRYCGSDTWIKRGSIGSEVSYERIDQHFVGRVHARGPDAVTWKPTEQVDDLRDSGLELSSLSAVVKVLNQFVGFAWQRGRAQQFIPLLIVDSIDGYHRAQVSLGYALGGVQDVAKLGAEFGRSAACVHRADYRLPEPPPSWQ